MNAPPPAAAFSPPRYARFVLRSAPTGALATLSEGGHPFASLVTVATTMRGEPVMLLSRLAVHTKNVARDKRASLLLVAPGGEGGDPLAGARLSLVGTVEKIDAPDEARRRFLGRHAEAEGYAGFADFAFYRLVIQSGHLVAGFGRIIDLTPDDLLVPEADVAELNETEPGAVEHMNDDHSEANRLYATKLLGLADGSWKTTGIDPDGMDLRSADGARARLEFPQRVTAGGPLRKVLRDLAEAARAK